MPGHRDIHACFIHKNAIFGIKLTYLLLMEVTLVPQPS